MKLHFPLNFLNKSFSISEDFQLEEQSVDVISAIIEDYLSSLKMDRSSIVRVRLSMEEALLRWMDHFGKQTNVHMNVGTNFSRPTITLMLTGDQYNPLVTSENDLGEWAESLFTGISLSPTYNYRKGVNILQLKMNRPERNPALKLLASVIVGGVIGILGKAFLPQSVISSILYTILDPIQNLFLRILNATSGPIIFLSVITATCAIGSMTAIGKSGRRMALRFISITFIVTLAAAAIVLKPLNITLVHQLFDENQFSSVLDLFLQAVPNDALTPIIQGNSPQMILIALIIGNALLQAGQKASRLQVIIEQADSLGLIIAGWVSRLSPFFVTVLFILGVWNGSISTMLSIWKPLLLASVLIILMGLLSVFRISIRHHIPMRLLFEKMKDSFRIAFRTSSVDSSIAENLICCEKRLGISKKLTSYGVPLGLISYMPATCVAVIVFVMYVANLYQVQISIVWLIIALILDVALEAATPPVAGVGILTYTALFAQLNIPLRALPIAMAVDILFGFLVTPINQAMLQMELITEAETLDLLNRDLLHKEMPNYRKK